MRRRPIADGSSSVLIVSESCHHSPSTGPRRPSVSIAMRSFWLIARTSAGLVAGSYRTEVSPSRSLGSFEPFAWRMNVRRIPSAPPNRPASNTTLSRGDACPDWDASVVVQSSWANPKAAKSTSWESSTSRSRVDRPGLNVVVQGSTSATSSSPRVIAWSSLACLPDDPRKMRGLFMCHRPELVTRGLARRVEERQIRHRRRHTAAPGLNRPLDLDPVAGLAVPRVDRGQRDDLLQDRAPGRAGRLADLAAPRVERNGDARGRRVERRSEPLRAVQLLEGLPVELQADEPPRRPASLLLSFERTAADEMCLLVEVDEAAEDAELERRERLLGDQRVPHGVEVDLDQDQAGFDPRDVEREHPS